MLVPHFYVTVTLVANDHFQLRDIFRVDPNTSCNTHDLLECPCNGMGKSLPLETIDTNRAPNDDNANDSDEDEMERGFMAASQVKSEIINKLDKAVRRVIQASNKC